MYWIICGAMFMVEINSFEIEKKVLDYFESGTVRTFYEDWQTHQFAMENAIQVGLTETYGRGGMNIFMRRSTEHLLNEGYLHYDNQIHLLILPMRLDELPNLRLPEVVYVLPNSVLQIESMLSRMVVRATYHAFRNFSDVIYANKDQDTAKSSPFRLQQVQPIGELAIAIEGCMLTGFVMTTLSGDSVIIGHDTLEISKCQYTLEISSGLGPPPVIVKYNMESEGLSLDTFLERPIRNEMLPKLQAVLYNYINTSAIFGDKLLKYRKHQEYIFNETTRFSDEFVQQYNKLTMEKNQGIIKMVDFSIIWNFESEDSANNSVLELRRVIVTGLDTLYSAHNGGPFRNPEMNIGDEIRFNSLQVSGELYYQNTLFNTSSEFSVILHDTGVDVAYVVNSNSNGKGAKGSTSSKSNNRFEIDTWRAIEFVIPNTEYILAESLLAGYVQSKLPKVLAQHLANIYEDIGKLSKNGHITIKNKKKCETVEEDTDEKVPENKVPDEKGTNEQTTDKNNLDEEGTDDIIEISVDVDDTKKRIPNAALEYFSPNTDIDRGRNCEEFTDVSDDAENHSGSDTNNRLVRSHPVNTSHKGEPLLVPIQNDHQRKVNGITLV